MGNKLTDLNNVLFKQLERLNNEGLTGKALDNEIVRANAMSVIAKEITSNGNLILRARIAVIDKKLPESFLPPHVGERGQRE